MNVLAIDTAEDFLSIALAKGSEIFSMDIDAGRRHSELLVPAMDSVCSIAQVKPAELDLLACTKGPGSFTGIRIAFAALKGIAAAHGTRTIAAPSLDVMAFPHTDFPGVVLPLVDAKQGRYFYALYKNGSRLTEHLDEKPETVLRRLVESGENENVLLTGPAAKMFATYLGLAEKTKFYVDPNYRGGGAKALLQFLAKDGRLEDADFGDFSPEYIRKSDAEIADELKAMSTGK